MITNFKLFERIDDFEIPEPDEFLKNPNPEFFDDFSSGDFTSFVLDMINTEDVYKFVPLLSIKNRISVLDKKHLFDEFFEFGFNDEVTEEFEFMLELTSYQEKDFFVLGTKSNRSVSEHKLFTNLDKLKDELESDIVSVIAYLSDYEDMISEVKSIKTFEEVLIYCEAINDVVYVSDLYCYYHKAQLPFDWDKKHKLYLAKNKSSEFNL